MYMIVDVTPRVLFVDKQSISVHPNSMLFLHLKKENRFKKDSINIERDYNSGKIIIMNLIRNVVAIPS